MTTDLLVTINTNLSSLFPKVSSLSTDFLSHQAEIKLSARPVISSKVSGSLSSLLSVDRMQFLEATGLRPSAPTQVVTVSCLHNLAIYFFKTKGKRTLILNLFCC